MHMDGPLINIGEEEGPRGESEETGAESPCPTKDEVSPPPSTSIDCHQTASATSTSNGRCDLTGTRSEKNHSGASSSSSMKHDRLKRDLSIDHQDASSEVRGDAAAMSAKDLKRMEAAESVPSSGSSYYGVRSYLDQFYDLSGSYKDPDLYEEDPDLLLLANSRRGSSRLRRWCGDKCWKVMAAIGFVCLLAGIVAIGLGILMPRRPPRTETTLSSQSGSVVAATASDQFNAEVCRLAGLVMFCVGGIVLAVALLVPSFPSSRHCCLDIEEEDWHTSYCALDDDLETPTHVSALRSAAQSIKAAVPATKRLTGIQPARVAGQTTLSSDIPY